MRVLFVTPTVPYPPRTGGRQRTHLLFTALRRIADVHSVVIGGEGQVDRSDWEVNRREFNVVASPVAKARGEFPPWSVVRPLAPTLVDRIAHNVGRREMDFRIDRGISRTIIELTTQRRFDAIVVRYLRPALKAGVFNVGPPVVVDVDDVELQLYAERLRSPQTPSWQRPILRRHLQQLAALLPDQLRRAAHIWFSCDEDAALAPHGRISVLPNIPFRQVAASSGPLPAALSEQGAVMVIGDFGHTPNRRGVDWFLRRVWPRILTEFPDASFRIVGGGAAAQVRRRWEAVDRVSVLGRVSDAALEYARASVLVAPLFEGGGTKIKVLEALSFGRALVATTHALRGYRAHLRDNESLLLADDAPAFARAVIRLLGDEQLRLQIAGAGTAIVSSRFSAVTFNEEVSRTLAGVVGGVTHSARDAELMGT